MLSSQTRTGSAPKPRRGTQAVIVYQRNKGVDAYVRAVSGATPMEIVAIERQGVQGIFIKDLSKRMDLATSRFFAILGVPKATAEKKAAAGELVSAAAAKPRSA